MLAVVETGGKQYLLEEGTVVSVEKLAMEPGKTVTLDKVLLLKSDENKVEIGQPYVKGANVTALVLEQSKDDKVTVFKFKRKTGYQKKQGHRQQFTTIKVEKISNK